MTRDNRNAIRAAAAVAFWLALIGAGLVVDRT
jgi:hypothetical protein